MRKPGQNLARKHMSMPLGSIPEHRPNWVRGTDTKPKLRVNYIRRFCLTYLKLFEMQLFHVFV